MAEIYLNQPIDDQLLKDAMTVPVEDTGLVIEGQEDNQQSSDISINFPLLEALVLKSIHYLSQEKSDSEVKQRSLSIFTRFDDFEENIMQILFKHNKSSMLWLFQLRQCDFEAAKNNIEKISVSNTLLSQIVTYSFSGLLGNTIPAYKRPQCIEGYTNYCLLLDELGFSEYTEDFTYVSKLIKRQTDGKLNSQRKAFHAVCGSANLRKQ